MLKEPQELKATITTPTITFKKIARPLKFIDGEGKEINLALKDGAVAYAPIFKTELDATKAYPGEKVLRITSKEDAP